VARPSRPRVLAASRRRPGVYQPFPNLGTLSFRPCRSFQNRPSFVIPRPQNPLYRASDSWQWDNVYGWTSNPESAMIRGVGRVNRSTPQPNSLTNCLMLAAITDGMNQLGQALVFASIGGAGLIVLAFSAFFGGEHHGGDGHADLSHDGDHGGPVSFFSPRIMAIFAVGFGACGAIATVLGAGVFGSVIGGFVAGAVMAGLGFVVVSLLYKQQVNSLLSTSGVVGKVGRVTTAIPEKGSGEVGVTLQSQYGTYLARSKDGQGIALGQPVRILSNVGGVLEVEACSPPA
jgi:hypothetical protein